MPSMFDQIQIGKLTVPNRVALSPMCQYQAENKRGIPENWHFVHLVSRAIGGTGLIFTEMTNVEPRGRITEQCLGIYNDEQVTKFREIVNEVHRYGSKIGLQLAHAGRKSVIKDGDIVGPSAIPFSEESPVPRELTVEEIRGIVKQFADGAKRAVDAGFDTIELHGAHGYLLHQFMSPASNKRSDEYGDYTKFPLEVIRAVKKVIPEDMPLILRVSAVEFSDGGYTFEQMLDYCRKFKDAGIDAFDVSTGGDCPTRPEVYPAYQTSYAEVYKKELNVPVISVGKLEDPNVAEAVIRNGQADMICIGKGMLRNPYWVKEAATELGVDLELPGVYNVAY
ncbi:NADH:flavin oxidoreductase/NADH oxidase [Salirhabdus salicampi]|uniref:NADH:flavin oxidoreductase/NADH oxidase n=1 Tax=Salirhabdus salicampi TaxID=476102 RepID=UPI0020C2866E|nr:NADH:flavin oxidoreductase/NADH oxidase [Salirhabdus salicampi]MCP8615709.1 NADH:flavin oxidoreductase/NADH oxidase [Salirhabdus salicampi]